MIAYAPLGRELARQRLDRDASIGRMLVRYRRCWLDVDPPTWDWPR